MMIKLLYFMSAPFVIALVVAIEIIVVIAFIVILVLSGVIDKF